LIAALKRLVSVPFRQTLEGSRKTHHKTKCIEAAVNTASG
jgi:hypothetical protein